MTQTGGQQVKRKAMQTVLDFIAEHEPLPRYKVLARLQVEGGLAKDTAKEWFNALHKGGYVTVEDGEVRTSE